ncbi:hypothetical protein M2635_27720, partial [Klebsiella pneumoniae]|nr:hypothetical protein [Klebsiella pneumoniae]
QNDVTLKMPAFEWVHVQLHQQKGMISLSPPTICNSAVLINKVLIAFALFGHRLVIKAGGDGVRDKTAVIVVCPARGFVE